ncbi:hypothetical protein LP420_07065 [Massilia sp. B-10]|nr:hypothetical protein LP420_07065 [Massilia sp. B-10]
MRSAAAAPADLAFRYAPVHYQDTDSSDYPSEYITAFDYDGDRDASNNWDNRGTRTGPPRSTTRSLKPAPTITSPTRSTIRATGPTPPSTRNTKTTSKAR